MVNGGIYVMTDQQVANMSQNRGNNHGDDSLNKDYCIFKDG